MNETTPERDAATAPDKVERAAAMFDVPAEMVALGQEIERSALAGSGAPTWQPQYIPKGDPMDPEGWYVRTSWDETDERKLVVPVKDEEAAKQIAEYLNDREAPAPEVPAAEQNPILDEILKLAERAKELPPLRTEPIKLTRSQMQQLAYTPPPWERINPAACAFGIPVVEVQSVVESTPYVEGWLSRG